MEVQFDQANNAASELQHKVATLERRAEQAEAEKAALSAENQRPREEVPIKAEGPDAQADFEAREARIAELESSLQELRQQLNTQEEVGLTSVACCGVLQKFAVAERHVLDMGAWLGDLRANLRDELGLELEDEQDQSFIHQMRAIVVSLKAAIFNTRAQLADSERKAEEMASGASEIEQVRGRMS